MVKSNRTRPFALRLAFALTSIVVAILAIHLLLQHLNLNVYNEQNGFVYELSNRLDLDDEISIPTWFSQILLFVVGVSGLVAATLQKTKAKRLLWTFIGALGIVLSIDEAASMHEFALQSLHNMFFLDTSPTTNENAWLVIAPFVLILALALVWQGIKLLPKRTVYLFALGGIVFLGGAIVIDIISVGVETGTFLHQGIMVALEETAELLGTIIVLYAIVDYIEIHHRDDFIKAAKSIKSQS